MQKIIESEYFTTFNNLPTSEQIKLMKDFWDFLDENPGEKSNLVRFKQYVEDRGIDMRDVPWETMNSLWDLAAEDEEDYSDEDNESIFIDGQEISDVSDARRWLNQKLRQYGNTYHFPESDKMGLTRLINKYGNTYFWR